MGNFGLRISQPGVDVKTGTDAQMVFTSKLNTLKIYTVANVSINIPANTAAVTIFTATYTHSLGFVPAMFAYPNDGNYAAQILCIPPDLGSGFSSPLPAVVDNCEFSYDLTSTYVKFYMRTYDSGSYPTKFWGSNPAYTITFKTYLFTQQIN